MAALFATVESTIGASLTNDPNRQKTLIYLSVNYYLKYKAKQVYVTAHHTVTVSSPSRWFCGLMSALPLLLRTSTLLLWWVFFWFNFIFLVFIFLSCCPHHLDSLGLTRQVHFAQEWHQESINHPRSPFLFLLSPSLSLSGGGEGHITAYSLEVILCFKPR